MPWGDSRRHLFIFMNVIRADGTVKLTRRERHEVFRRMWDGEPMPEHGPLSLLPNAQVERIWREFAPGTPRVKVMEKPTGIRGNTWFCENGCGVVLLTKSDGEVFSRKNGERRLLFCDACFKAFEAARMLQEATIPA